MNYPKTYDVIIIGGGHAGTEAALASARMGAETLLLTHSIETLGQMSCNPAIGGIGKGHLVREIDALGGVMARAADRAGIHFRRLNGSKGPAVRATRAQADRQLYRQAIRETLENQENLTLFQQAVDDLILDGDQVVGVVTQMGMRIKAKAIVLTVGTFLGGRIHIGEANYRGGRAGDPPSLALADRLRELSLKVGRLKTGTPPRIDGRTIDYSGLKAQPGDTACPVFSFTGSVLDHPQQIHCHITHTTEKTHEIIRGGLSRSPMYTGVIEGVGPRYCPSIEDKVVRFSDKSSHQIFIEPEGLNTHEIYPNGISTSLPFDVQYDFVRSIVGFQNAVITRPGYAIEYDYFDPRGLKASLETKSLSNLFFAGQINGTTGYEEAAAQGLLAAINAVLKINDKEAWSPRRDEAYLGVLVDDLITRGTKEPYRMFTSRAEYRLLLREDNADLRLTEIGRKLGLVGDHQWANFCEKRENIERAQQQLRDAWVRPDTQESQTFTKQFAQKISKEHRASDLLRRPEVTLAPLVDAIGLSLNGDLAVYEQVEIQAKYEGYLSRQKDEIARQARYQETALPEGIDYDGVVGLSSEVRQKLIDSRPETVGQASRVPGITPAAISLLLVHLKKMGALSRRRSA